MMNAETYRDFVGKKLTRVPPAGLDVEPPDRGLFDFQRDLVRWALRRGRCAIFASTGLGKSRMQVAWADAVSHATGGRVLMLAPLAVASQTVNEGRTIGVDVRHCRDGSEVSGPITITNYDRLHLFDPAAFVGVVLDESSIIKHHDAKTLRTLIDSFGVTPYRLACTATPAPNDFVELGTHAEFLGICSRAEMLAEYFCHDGGETQKWRLKGHARRKFWEFVASWGALVRSPSDLGYDGSAYVLPPITVHHHTIEADAAAVKAAGLLFAEPAATLMERRKARRASVGDRVKRCADLVNSDDLPWVVWCDLNDESDALTRSIRGAVEVRGSMTSDEKERALASFASGESRVIVSKPSICGFGLNWQHCNRMAFVGVTDSWEAYHQATKRIHRFGQTKPCEVHVFASELEGAVVKNLQRKERDAEVMGAELSAEVSGAVTAQVRGTSRVTNGYDASTAMAIPAWLTSEGE